MGVCDLYHSSGRARSIGLKKGDVKFNSNSNSNSDSNSNSSSSSSSISGGPEMGKLKWVS